MNAPVVTVRSSGWADLPAVTGVWTAAGSQVVPESEVRAALEHGPGLPLVAEAPGIDLLVLPDDAAGLACWQRLGHLPCPDVLCSEPLDGVAATVSG